MLKYAPPGRPLRPHPAGSPRQRLTVPQGHGVECGASRHRRDTYMATFEWKGFDYAMEADLNEVGIVKRAHG